MLYSHILSSKQTNKQKGHRRRRAGDEGEVTEVETVVVS